MMICSRDSSYLKLNKNRTPRHALYAVKRVLELPYALVARHVDDSVRSIRSTVLGFYACPWKKRSGTGTPSLLRASNKRAHLTRSTAKYTGAFQNFSPITELLGCGT